MNRVLLAATGVAVTVAAFGENAVGCELGGTRQAPRAGNVAAAQESAARALESLITVRGPEAAAAEYRKTVAGNGRYVVVEREFAALGERYRQSGRVREEIAVFEIATEALPHAWSAWNRLGEAYELLSWNPEFARVAGDLLDKAEACYAKSVALNRRNDKVRDNLDWVRARKFDAANETKTPLRFVPGAQTKLTGPYLGQPAPGLVPQVFAPGIVSVAASWDAAITFTPDGREMYFTQRKDGGQNTVMVSRLGTDGWTSPADAAFAKALIGSWVFEPHITPDGRKLYFGGRRGLWEAERIAGGGWGEPTYFGPGMYVSVAQNGNLYMTDIGWLTGTGRAPAATSRAPGVVRRWTGTEYAPPQRLPGAINSPAAADHSFIAPDESYILFDSMRPGGQGGSDLYVCFRKPDSSWSEAMNLGDGVNTPGGNIAPSVSPDGKYIFYTANGDIYWVSAAILEPLRAKALR